MRLTRAELLRAVSAFEATATLEPRLWDIAYERIVSSAAPEDKEWARDRIQDAGYRMGIVGEDAQDVRRFAASGTKYFEDDQPSRPPWPYFGCVRVVGPAEALAKLAAGGGQGMTTWGYSERLEVVWVSHADPRSTHEDRVAATNLVRAELDRLGLTIAS